MIVLEDENTGYQTHSALSKMFHLIARTHREGVGSRAYQRHAIKRSDFMWLTKDGMLVSGMNGNQCWDIMIMSEAMIETGLAQQEENKESLLKAFQWLDDAQIREDPLHFDPAYRHSTKGSWPFRYAFSIVSLGTKTLTEIAELSTRESTYSVADCAAEGLKTVIQFQSSLEYVVSIRHAFNFEVLTNHL